jgi:nicotinamidase-related amidase
MGIDSLIIVGGSTSGCVRATSVDAVSRNFKVAVVEDCVYDRIELSHKAGLLDLWMKYTDVINLEEVSDYINNLR